MRRVRVIPSGDEASVLSPLPLAALRLPAETIEALSQVGLKRIADVLDRPRAPLAARFGADFVRRLDQALGREDEPIAPRLPVPAAITEQRFAEPIALERDVLGTIERLAGKLGALLERRGEGARLLQAALFRTDGKVFRIEVGLSEPLREAARIRHLFADRLGIIGDEVDPGFGYDMLRLAALVTERCEPTQTGLAQPDHAAELAHLIDRLGARFGLRRVTRFVAQDTHIPEFAVAAVGAASVSAHARERGHPVLGPGSPLSRGRAEIEARLPHPHPPDPPVRTAGSHRGNCRSARQCAGPFSLAPRMHQVIHAEGPERIAMQWWRDDKNRALTRDYFRVESQEGLRIWLYREGLFDGEERSTLVRTWRIRMTKVYALPTNKKHRSSSWEASAPTYAELAVTTNFSFLRGASHPEELVKQARVLGLTGIGVADRNSVAGVVRAHTAASGINRKIRELNSEVGTNQPELKIAVGARLVFDDGTPDILVYPRDRAGWGRLTRLLSLGKRRADKGECLLGLPDLLDFCEGLNLIVMPPSRLASVNKKERSREFEDQLDNILIRLQRAAPHRVWLAASLAYRGDDVRRFKKLAAIAAKVSVPLIAVNDVLYHAPKRRMLQDIVTCIREHVTIDKAGRLLEANAERHLKPPKEMTRLFRRIPEAIEQTLFFSSDAVSHSAVARRPNTRKRPVRDLLRRRKRSWSLPRKVSNSAIRKMHPLKYAMH